MIQNTSQAGQTTIIFNNKQHYLWHSDRRSIEKKPLVKTAELLLQAGDFQAAVAKLKEQLQLTPEDVVIHLMLGRAYIALEETDKARHCCEKVLEFKVLFNEVCYLLGLCYEQEGDFELALVMLKQVVYRQSNLVLAYLHLALLYQKMENMSKSIAYCMLTITLLESLPHKQLLPLSNGNTVQQTLQVARTLYVDLQAVRRETDS